MKGVSYQCEVRPGGKLPGVISDALRSVLRGAVGKVITISVQEEIRIRSLNQNRYYWGVVVPPIHELFVRAGNNVTKAQVHEYLKQFVCASMFMQTLILPDGKPRQIVRSSTDLSKSEWETFMEMVRAWASEWDLIIPLPNEVMTQAEGGDDDG